MMENKNRPLNWGYPLRIVIKATLFILFLNLVFAAISPLENLGRLSLYNGLFPGRQRLPYGENAQESYNLSLFNIPAMVASHTIDQPKANDEFRVFIIGDSAAWGWLLENDDSLAGAINQADHITRDGKRVVAYNLGYPIMSLTKDLMILDAAMAHEPDLIIWPVTLESFPRDKQLFSPIVQNNPQRIRPLITRYDLQLDPQDPRFIDPAFQEQTIIGQRRNLADLLRHQFYGLSWAATGIDQVIPQEIPLRRSDFDEDISWQDYQEPLPLTGKELAFDALAAGVAMAGDVPLFIVNEPMFISSGRNSDLRYNSFYPRWAYDQYRKLLQETAADNNWRYLDLWDSIPPGEFTDTPVHLTPAGSRQMAVRLGEESLELK
jgi:hypothetical protein